MQNRAIYPLFYMSAYKLLHAGYCTRTLFKYILTFNFKDKTSDARCAQIQRRVYESERGLTALLTSAVPEMLLILMLILFGAAIMTDVLILHAGSLRR